jgi:hypothetical protein
MFLDQAKKEIMHAINNDHAGRVKIRQTIQFRPPYPSVGNSFLPFLSIFGVQITLG